MLMDESSIALIFNSFASMLPSLAGTLIGGGVTLLAAHMTIKHQNELEDKKKKINA